MLLKKSISVSCLLLSVLLALLLGSSTIFSPSVEATVVADKTPNDVFLQVHLLAENVRILRNKNNITSPWPKVTIREGYKPRHVLQKALEVLGKINQFRIHVRKTGEISVPRFPGRDITPNEVYNAVVRLRRELDLLIREAGLSNEIKTGSHIKIVGNSKTPSDVYAALAEISLALDETLGLRGFTPSDVYMQSLRILNLAIFLRKSQNLSLDIPKPLITSGKLPNHALQSSYRLLKKISHAERNLWMKPLTVPKLPRRIITPVDVFDATSVALAELQRIKFRLGLERNFEDPQQEKGKNPTM